MSCDFRLLDARCACGCFHCVVDSSCSCRACSFLRKRHVHFSAVTQRISHADNYWYWAYLGVADIGSSKCDLSHMSVTVSGNATREDAEQPLIGPIRNDGTDLEKGLSQK